jgi:prepilin-type N-terminal cleavage/methylation domain-containing protein
VSRLRAALRRRLDPKSDSGLSLVELIVVMFITGIVLAIVGSMFINVAYVTANSNSTTTRSSIAANVMNEMSEVIRTAANNAVVTSDDPDPAIVSGTVSALTVYSYVDTSATNPMPSKVTFRVDSSGTVFEDRIVGTVSGSYYVFTGATTTRNLGGPVLATSLFTYLDASNQVVTPATAGTPPSLSLLQRNAVASVKVTITIANNTTTKGSTSAPGGNDPVTIIKTIGMPNLLLTGTDD